MTKLFVITGLSGSGKDSVINGLEQEGLDYTKIITTTTRPIRRGEQEGDPYHFVSEDKFKKMISQNEFFEWAVVYTNYYGNTKTAVEQALSTGKPVILRIDCQGARTIKEKYPESVVIFIKPLSMKILEQRLKKRGLDSKEVIKHRLAQVKKEMEALEQWDYIVINEQGKLKDAIKNVKKIILKEYTK